MKYELSTDRERQAIVLRGELTAPDRKDFDAMADTIAMSAGETIVVDLKGLAFMDSAALGMLLSLRGRATEADATVVLALIPGDVKDLLELTWFNTLFAFE